MKKTRITAILTVLCMVLCVLSGCVDLENVSVETEDTGMERKPDAESFDGDGISLIEITSLPYADSYRRVFVAKNKIEAVAEYIRSLELTNDFEEDPNEYTGMTWVIRLEYADGSEREYYHFGNMFFRENGGEWKKMNYEQAAAFDRLVYDHSSDEITGDVLRDRADIAVTEKYGIKDLSKYDIELTKDDGKDVLVSYTLLIHGYPTGEHHTVFLDRESGEVKRILGDEREYSRFSDKVTKYDISKARSRIYERHAGLLAELSLSGTHPDFYLTIDSEGYLCLRSELIIKGDGPVDAEGAEVEICPTHRHVIVNERISKV